MPANRRSHLIGWTAIPDNRASRWMVSVGADDPISRQPCRQDDRNALHKIHQDTAESSDALCALQSRRWPGKISEVDEVIVRPEILLTYYCFTMLIIRKSTFSDCESQRAVSSRAAFVFGALAIFVWTSMATTVSAEPSTSRGQISVAQVKVMLDQSLTNPIARQVLTAYLSGAGETAGWLVDAATGQDCCSIRARDV